MSGNSGSQGTASGFDGTHRFSRDNLVRELAGARAISPRDVPADAIPMTASELHELERLIRRYPVQAREFLDGPASP